MSKQLSSRILFWPLLAAAILVAVLGIYQGAYMIWARRTVEYALSGGAGSNIPRERLRGLGERAVPLVYDEMRAHPGKDSNQVFFGAMVLCGMALDGKLDARIPYLGRVLKDTTEDKTLREWTACIVSKMWYSDHARDALEERALRDPSIEMRASCLGYLGGHAATRAAYTNKPCDLAPRIIAMLDKASKDPDPRIRLGACGAAGELAQWASEHDTSLPWADSILARAAKDPDTGVREDYAAIMHGIRQIEKSRP